jgi:hypothetical protein
VADLSARHLGWVFDGTAEFEARSGSFLARGVARSERLLVVCDDPRPHLWPASLVNEGTLVLLSTTEVYGSDRVVNPDAQRATFEQTLSDALWSGFTGLRMVADNTSLVSGPDRLAAWARWEDQAEQLMQALPITGLCAFDRTRTGVTALRTLRSIHSVTPQWVPA